MAETVTLIDHQAIRDWAAARIGVPAIVDVSPESGTQPLLRIVFDQAAYQNEYRSEQLSPYGGIEFVEWDDWFKVFDENGLALVVATEHPGRLDSYHEFVRR